MKKEPAGFEIVWPESRVEADGASPPGGPPECGKPLSPLVFASPHSGRFYPPALLDASLLSPLDLRSSEDAFVDELFAHVPGQGAPLLKATHARAFLDLNREPYELDPALIAGKLPPFANTASHRVKSGLGTIPRMVGRGLETGTPMLSLEAAMKRIRHIYFPYHAALKSLLDAAHEAFGLAILIDCHSMPSRFDHGYSRQSPDFAIGDRHGRSCHPRLTRLVVGAIRDMGYEARANDPFAGGYCTQEYGRPAKNRHAIQIEISRGLYLDENRIEKNSGFNALRRDLEKLSARLIDQAPRLLAPRSSRRLAAE